MEMIDVLAQVDWLGAELGRVLEENQRLKRQRDADVRDKKHIPPSDYFNERNIARTEQALSLEPPVAIPQAGRDENGSEYTAGAWYYSLSSSTHPSDANIIEAVAATFAKKQIARSKAEALKASARRRVLRTLSS